MDGVTNTIDFPDNSDLEWADSASTVNSSSGKKSLPGKNMSMQSACRLPLNIRSLIYSHMDLLSLLNQVSKLSK